MARLSEIEERRVQRAAQPFLAVRRPPVAIREQLDIGWRLVGCSLEVFSIRPAYQGAAGEMMEYPAGKATWVTSRRLWKLYWMRADLRWHGYPERPTVRYVEDFFNELMRGPMRRFWG